MPKGHHSYRKKFTPRKQEEITQIPSGFKSWEQLPPEMKQELLRQAQSSTRKNNKKLLK